MTRFSFESNSIRKLQTLLPKPFLYSRYSYWPCSFHLRQIIHFVQFNIGRWAKKNFHCHSVHWLFNYKWKVMQINTFKQTPGEYTKLWIIYKWNFIRWLWFWLMCCYYSFRLFKKHFLIHKWSDILWLIEIIFSIDCLFPNFTKNQTQYFLNSLWYDVIFLPF